MLEKALLTPKLTDKAKAYQFSEFCKHVRISTAPAVGAAVLLLLFEYQHSTGLIWLWFVLMLLIQALRYSASRLASLNCHTAQKWILLFSVYIAGIGYVSYLYLFTGPQVTHTESVFRSFFVYMLFVYHLEVVRYDLRLLILGAMVITVGLICYVLLMGTYSQDAKLT